ncbi:hypothetical protein ACIGO9_14925 [Nocardia asteroides]|uniref:hypothetical protein n=1 Tax=Nocardia asteroides TaxID=1824 RepID=UPI0037CB5BDA
MTVANATPSQRRVLKALQNQAADMRSRQDSQQASGTEPTPAWTQDMASRTTQRNELAAAAEAGGVPDAWIDQARERGAKNIRWNTNLFLRPASRVDRNILLERLGADYALLARFCGIHANYGPVAATTEPTARNTVDQVVSTLWQRSTQIGVLLGVDAAEAQQHWPTTEWMHTAAAAAAGLSADQLAHQWRQIAATDITSYSTQVLALSKAGITPDPQFAPPDPSTALATLAQHHLHPQVQFSDAEGAQIEAAVAATGTQAGDLAEPDPLMNPPEFSHEPHRNTPGIEL